MILACVAGLFLSASQAQPQPRIVGKLTTDEGLTSNTINDIVQDDRGFLWIATPDGLNRFDGTEVTQFYHRSTSNSLPHNWVYCLKKLPDNYLAIGTQAGLSFYDGNTGSFRNLYYRVGNGLDPYNNMILRLDTDVEGNLWALSRNCIFIYDKHRELKKVITSPFPAERLAAQRENYVDKVWPLSNGSMLLDMYNGWHLYAAGSIEDTTQSTFLRTLNFLRFLPLGVPAHGYSDITPSAHVFKIFSSYFFTIPRYKDSLQIYDESGKLLSSCHFPFNRYPYILWSQETITLDSTHLLLLLHNFGLISIDITWNRGIPAFGRSSPLLFADYEYKTALLDHQGVLWLATVSEGLQKIVPPDQPFVGSALIDRSDGKPVRYEATSFCQDREKLWVCTYGNGFFSVDTATGKQRQFHLRNTSNDLWANFVWNIRRVSPDSLWIGTQAGLFWFCTSDLTHGRIPHLPGKPAILDSVAITSQFQDSRGLIWLGLGRGGGLCYYDPASHSFTWWRGTTKGGYPFRYPMYIAERSDGDIWCTSDASTSLVHWRRSSGTFQVVPIPAPPGVHIGNLNGLTLEGDSIIWMGSLTCGLLKFNLLTGEVRVFDRENGLANSHIGSLASDKFGRIWLVTQGGLSCFNLPTSTFVNYSLKNGLPVKYPTARFYYDTVNQTLYNGGHGHYFHFRPETIQAGADAPDACITSVLVNGKPWMLEDNGPVGFPPQQNDISIQYTAVDLVDGPALSYAYRLEGADTAWMPAGKQRQIHFSHLSPGFYTFLVKARGVNGVWSRRTANFSFRIYPPFTRTFWFYLILFLGAGTLVWLISDYRLRQVKRTRQIRSEISRNLHDEVGGNLTNISLSSLLAQKNLNDRSVVNQLLERIYQDSQQVSESMREIVWSINPRIDTIGEALPRMLHYASRLLEANGIELEALVSPEVEAVKLGMRQRRDFYMIFKETINNMAKHSGASRAAIQFRLSGSTLVMKVQDNGSGFDAAAQPARNGLKNIEERAREHQWRLDIRSGPGEGTSITLQTGTA
jgi:ligand-binding sensor domain-containing protein/two-component sensor histidine kinase